MKIVDTGVREQSFMDFTFPSEFAQTALYYSPQFGHFSCNENYCIDREYLDLYLLIYVCGGELEVSAKGRTVKAAANEIVLLDCHQPHRYCCTESADFLWFHFKGGSSGQYVDYLFERFGLLFSGEAIKMLRKNFEVILSCTQQVIPNEHIISLNIHSVLSQLATEEQSTVMIHNMLSPALDHIHNNFSEPIDLRLLAELCNMSVSHFIRSFKKYINCTPHEYLLAYRLRQAKQILLSSGASIDMIAERCGFNSASHFARAFRKDNGLTPSEFRKMHF